MKLSVPPGGMPLVPIQRAAVLPEGARLQLGQSREAGRRLVLPKRIGHWLLRGLQQRLVPPRGKDD